MEQQLNYSFTPIPKKLMYCLDRNCRSMLFALVDLTYRFQSNTFYRSNEDLQKDTDLSKNLVIATLDTFYRQGLIDIDCVGKGTGRKTNVITLHTEKFNDWEKYSFEDVRNLPELKINTVKYKGTGFKASYVTKEIEVSCFTNSQDISQLHSQEVSQQVSQKVNTIKETIDTVEYNKETIENNINTVNNNKNDSQKVNTYTKDIDYYFECFFNPACDYSSLVTNIDFFKNWYKEDLYSLKDKLQNKLNVDIPINEIVQKLQYEYTKEKP